MYDLNAPERHRASWLATVTLLGATLIAGSAMAGPDVFKNQSTKLNARIQVRTPVQVQRLQPAARPLPAQPISVPELDPTGAPAALGLLACGGLLLAARRRRRR